MSKLVTTYLEQIYNTDDVTERIDVSAGIIFKEQRGEKPALLLIQRAEDDHWPLYWETPRGKCDNGDNEKLVPCLKREIKEETGLNIVPLRKIDSFQYTAHKGTRLSTQHNFLCKMEDPEQLVKLSKEHQDYKWITTAGEAELLVLPEMKKSIIKAFALLDGDGQINNLPSNEFTPTGNIEEGAGTAAALVVGGTLTAAALFKLKVRRQCKKLYPDDPKKQSICRGLPSWKRKKL